jgi:hypothetical protein
MLAVLQISIGMAIHAYIMVKRLEPHVLMDTIGVELNASHIREMTELHLVIKIVNGIQGLWAVLSMTKTSMKRREVNIQFGEIVLITTIGMVKHVMD